MNMKKLMIGLLVLTLLLAMLTGCGSKKDEPAPAQDAEQAAEAQDAEQAAEAQDGETQEAGQDAAAQDDGEPSADDAEAETAVDPYAWMGLEDVPKCNYLDILSTNNYVQVYDTYVLGIKAEVTDACKGLKTYQKNGNNLSYNIEGMIYSLNTDAKQYASYDMTSSIEDVRTAMEDAMAKGTNNKGRALQDTGASAIPLYSETEGDTAEYEYYEYSIGDSVTERYFMKDGDVFAIYTRTHAGDSDLETTNVIKSISGDVPDDLFTVPDLTDYTKIN